jgi:serine/threonine-protein kinase
MVSCYGADRARVRQTLRSALKTPLKLSELMTALVSAGHLTADQASELRRALRSGRLPPTPPRSLGGCRILRRLGEGGMGAVYLGYHEGEKRQVAIKVLAAELADNPICVACFYRESKSSALLDHPNLVRGITAGRDETSGMHFLVREFVDGPSAHALLERLGRLPVGDAVRIGLDVARALDYLHGRRLVHRDIKPDNILLSRAGAAKLTDLGLLKRIGEPRSSTALQGFGTSYYMPCEQALNSQLVDGRSDIFALGASLYHLLTGRVPFPGDSHQEIIALKERGVFPAAHDVSADVPPELDAILQRMLARRPDERYQSARELMVDLERTQLAAEVPSYTGLNFEPETESKPPHETSQPTSFDMRGPAAAATPGVWYLRYQDREGGWHRAKMSTQRVLRRLRSGRLPVSATAAPQRDGAFQPLSTIPVFRAAAAAPRAETPLELQQTRPSVVDIALPTPVLRGPSAMQIATFAALLTALAAVVCYLLLPS